MEQFAEQIQSLAREIGVAVDEPQAGALVAYLDLLTKWNAKTNLVGPGTKESWVGRHVIDSLAPCDWFSRAPLVLDIGSGAGLPGIPLAVVLGSTRFVLVEPRANRVAFLRSAVAGLKLTNVEVRSGRAETLQEQFPFVTGRAVAPPEEFARLAAAVASSAGKLVLFAQSEPAVRLGASAERLEWKDYRIGAEPSRAVGLYRLFHVEHR